MGALPIHHTATSDEAWDGPAAEKAIDKTKPVSEWKWEYAWEDTGAVDPEADGTDKEDFKFPHHFVDGDSEIGAASTKACSSGIGVLNGGMGGADIPDADREGVYEHLVAHLKDSGVADADLPKLEPRSVSVEAAELRAIARAAQRKAELVARGIRVWGGEKDESSRKPRQRRALAPLREVRRTQAPSAISLSSSVTRTAAAVSAGTVEPGELVEVVGTVIVYGVPYEVWDPWGCFTETIHYGAAAAVLAQKPDSRFLTQHESATVLARTTSETATLTLTDTPEGLQVKAMIDPRITDGADLLLRLGHDLITQMSVGMVIDERADVWSGEDDWGMPNVRDIYGLCEIPDVSAVTYPASTTTSIGLGRSWGQVPSESRARIRKLWEMAREGRAGKLSQHDCETLMRALEQIDQGGDIRSRFVPRDASAAAAYDHVVTAAIGQAQAALTAAVEAQAGDAGNLSNPADEAVWEHLTAALVELNQAVAAQEVDQAEAEDAAAAELGSQGVTETDDAVFDTDPDGTGGSAGGNAPVPDNDDGTGSRAEASEMERRRRQIEIDIDLLRLSRRPRH